jgi:transcriptional regulator with XRE-family HTH domain
VETGEYSRLLLAADFQQMNLTQMHERLRLELLRRIQRGTLSVSLLARQSGFGQSHLSNFLHSRRQLSLEAMDRILAAQHMAAADLLPDNFNSLQTNHKPSEVPVVSYSAALYEPYIRPTAVHTMLRLPDGLLESTRARSSKQRKAWQRFVAICIASAEALPMDPLVLPDAIVLVDRHYNSLMPYRPDRPNVYVVRHETRLALRYLDFTSSRLVLRPHNITCPVDLIEVGPGESPNDLITGRVVLIVNEL